MLSPSDFESWQVFAQAALVGLAAVMSWRGLHLSGDKHGRARLLWGAVSAASVCAALFLSAWSNHDAREMVTAADKRAKASTEELTKIQQSIDGLNNQNAILVSVISKIADAANINPNQSTQSLANQIIDRLSIIQRQIDQTKSHLDELEHPPPDQNSIYQAGHKIADVIRGRIDLVRGVVLFEEIDNAAAINFSKEMKIRVYTIKCPPTPFYFWMGTSPITHRWATAVITNLMCEIVATDLPAASPPSPTPPSSPAGR